MLIRIITLVAFTGLLYGQNPMRRDVVCTDAGSTDAYACTPVPALGSYTTGLRVQLYPNTANTGAATVNISALGAQTIKKVAGGITTDLADNDIRVGQYVDLVYDGTNFQMQSLLGNAPAGGAFGESSLATLVNNQILWDSANASRTLTFGLSGATDPVLTASDGILNLSTGTLQVGGSGVLTAASGTFNGVTYPSSGTSGGILGYTATGAVSSSGLLTQYGVLIGGGAGATPVATAAGTTGQLLRATSSANPSWSTATYPNTVTSGRLLWASGTNAISDNANATMSSGALTLGVPGSVVGSVAFGNATSGTVTISPTTGALGSTAITAPAINGTMGIRISSNTATLGTSSISSGACATVVTVSAPGVATTDVISFTPNADITAVTGYAPATTGGLVIYPYPTANNVNFKVCNPTASAITPGAVTLNWVVSR